jgi:hypothetical protein
MTKGITITREVHFRHGRGRRKVLAEGARPGTVSAPAARVPRVARLMALAIGLDRLVKSAEVADYAELARLGHVTRARITQIMNLLHLAPDIQEEILFLPKTENGRDPISERDLRPICGITDWRKQRKAWQALLDTPDWLRDNPL